MTQRTHSPAGQPEAPRAEVVVIGGSAGSVDALLALLPGLSVDFPLPIVAVIHRPRGRDSTLAEVLAAHCALQVRDVEDKERISPGTLFLAPPDYHVLIEKDRRLSLSMDAPVLFSRPSIDVLFESAADALGKATVGVVLTGASSDGAHGLRAIYEAGGVAVVQDPDTASVRTMPEAAIASCPRAHCLPPLAISKFLQEVALRS